MESMTWMVVSVAAAKQELVGDQAVMTIFPTSSKVSIHTGGESTHSVSRPGGCAALSRTLANTSNTEMILKAKR